MNARYFECGKMAPLGSSAPRAVYPARRRKKKVVYRPAFQGFETFSIGHFVAQVQGEAHKREMRAVSNICGKERSGDEPSRRFRASITGDGEKKLPRSLAAE